MFKDYNEMYPENVKKEKPEVYNKEGNIRMFNQGQYEWNFTESKDKCKITFRIAVPKFMDTSSLNVQVEPLYIRIEVKDKVT